MRVAILGIYHESNTFVERPTVYKDFENSHLLMGQAIVEEYEDAYHEIGGLISSLTCKEIEVLPVYFAEATPGGTIDAGCYRLLLHEMMDALEQVLPVDGLMVVVHGAAVSDEFPDMDGDWLSRVRERVGPDVPIVGTLDPHGNVSELMVDSTDALIAYRSNPHIDQRETGMKAGQLMKRLLVEKIRVNQLFVQLPLAISIEQQNTAMEPCASLYRLAERMEAEGEIICLSILLGFPYADVLEMGMSLVIVTYDDQPGARSASGRIREHILRNKQAFIGRKQRVDEIFPTMAALPKPVLLLDMGDNIGGGSSGDSTFLLDALERHGLSNACICICNPDAILQSAKYGVGDHFSISLKGANEYNREEPYVVQLLSRQDGSFDELNPRHGGQRHYDMGEVVIVKTSAGNSILLSSLRVPPFSSQQLSAFGLLPETFDYIIAKGVNAPIAAFETICKTIVQVIRRGRLRQI